MKKFVIPVFVLFSCGADDSGSRLEKFSDLQQESKRAFENPEKKIDTVLIENTMMESLDVRLSKIDCVEVKVEEIKKEADKVIALMEERKLPLELLEENELINNLEVVKETNDSVSVVEDIVDYNSYWEMILKRVSSNGIVDYSSLVNEKKVLVEYLDSLKSNSPAKGIKGDKALCYYINLYNASTIELILNNYPLKSITDIGKPWNIPFVKLGAETITLNKLENEIIRPLFREPRIHFALNCAAVSCPKLSNKPYKEESLNNQLKVATEKFLSDPKYGMEIKGEKVRVSQIFEWYKDDFGGKDQILNWITANSSFDLTGKKLDGFITYDWVLNGN